LKRLFEEHRYKVLKGGRGSAKCLGLGTKVLMYDGSIKNVENVQVGEQVMGADNLPRNVLSVTRGCGELYQIKQTSGMDYIVNSEHVLSLKKRKTCLSDLRINKYGNARNAKGRYPLFPHITNIKVTDAQEKSQRWKDSFRGYRAAHRIPCLLPRKKIKPEDVKPNKDFLLSQVSIESIGIGEYAGFSLDGDHLFCLEDGTVTHNSESVARYCLIKGMEKPRKIVCGREIQASIKESVYDMLVSFINMYHLESFYRVLKTEIIGENGTTFSFVGLRHNIASIKSMYDVDIFWGEEAQTFSANSLTVLLPTVRAKGSELIFTMNPELEEDPAYEILVD